MRRHFRDGPVKGIVEASVVCCRRENRLRGSNKRQRLRDVQRREMRGRAQLVQELWGDELVREELGPSVHDAMAYSHGRGVNMLLECSPERGKRIALRLENTFPQYQCFSVGRTNV